MLLAFHAPPFGVGLDGSDSPQRRYPPKAGQQVGDVSICIHFLSPLHLGFRNIQLIRTTPTLLIL
ncbi:hypothetical protein [Sinorhizobium fredii]|uniref:hypothetical protein n=1 Tax=Rhizobium fredii TaxID=380 RepID=UPI0011D24135|nr:hypothetical protein [Sinorhizobium fredii]WOS65889.1 hypothetical protein SFGR64A_19265 [Sinorhizobium fredii GR64]